VGGNEGGEREAGIKIMGKGGNEDKVGESEVGNQTGYKGEIGG
jgi:hypothetical protein